MTQVNTHSLLFTLPTIPLLFLLTPRQRSFCVSLTAKAVLSCLLKVDPAHRITASELLHNSWVTVRTRALLLCPSVAECLGGRMIERDDISGRHVHDRLSHQRAADDATVP